MVQRMADEYKPCEHDTTMIDGLKDTMEGIAGITDAIVEVMKAIVRVPIDLLDMYS